MKKEIRDNSIGNTKLPDSKNKDRLINLIIVITIILFGLSVGTQYFAHVAKYDSGLGFSIGKFYMPWNILIWYGKWHNLYPTPLRSALNISVLIMLIGMMGLLVYITIRRNTNKANDILHGSARWAGKKDIERAGLTDIGNAEKKNETGGVIVGGWTDTEGTVHYLKHFGSEHVLTIAPTRSGKGVGLVIPTLLTWTSSMVSIDLKGELWALTAGWRKKYAKNKVIRFQPVAESSACWNPLEEIRLGTIHQIGDIQNLATLIVDPRGEGLKSHWDKTAFSLLTGLILFALIKERKQGKTATLAGIDAMLSNPEQPVADLWVEMATKSNEYTDDENASRIIASSAQDMLDRPEEEAGSVLSTVKTYLALYRDPVVGKNTSYSDFHIRDLMHYESPVSLYVIMEPTDKERLKPLTRILYSMIFRLLASGMEFEKGKAKATYKHRLLFMGEEIASQGKLEILEESLAYSAGYGILCYLIFQDINQIRKPEMYGQYETVSSNCHIQNAYQPNLLDTAEYLSKLTGTTTVLHEQITTSGKRAGLILGQVSRTTQAVQRPLLTPDECMRMRPPEKDGDRITKAGEMLIYIAGMPAIRGTQVLFFQDPVYSARAEVPAPRSTDYLRGKN